VKAAALLLLAATTLIPAEREGNFTIRFEPKAILQTGTPVPFEIDVNDSLHKPVQQATVTLQIETPEHKNVKLFRAPASEPGVYVAKPVFPESGEWNVYVEVRLADQLSSRMIQFNVAN
jgi:acetylornithine deacetylase/succinyl-diaminopimelate desuccinylase-like protein